MSLCTSQQKVDLADTVAILSQHCQARSLTPTPSLVETDRSSLLSKSRTSPYGRSSLPTFLLLLLTMSAVRSTLSRSRMQFVRSLLAFSTSHSLIVANERGEVQIRIRPKASASRSPGIVRLEMGGKGTSKLAIQCSLIY